MYRGIAWKGAVALAALGMTAPLAAAAASASPAPNVSFSASNDGASAGWTAGKGSAIDLTLGSSGGSYAVITLHHVDGTVSSVDEPSFTTDNYAAGSPRYYVTLSDGHSLWGYPSASGLNGSDMAWAVDNGNTYESWTAVQSQEGSAEVSGAWVIADAGQQAGTTDEITGLSFGDTTFN